LLALAAAVSLLFFLFAPLVPTEEAGTAAHYRGMLSALILPALVFIFIPVSIHVIARKRWLQAIEVRAPRTYIFTSSGFEVVADSFHFSGSWDTIVSAQQEKAVIYLGTAQKQFYIIPVSDFASPEELGQFKQLVSTKVRGSSL
jgi:hypothetical protein